MGDKIFRRLILLFILLIFGCTSNDSGDSKHLEVFKFNVDPELLGDPVHLDTHGIGFNPPIGWSPLADDMLKEVKETLYNTQSDDPVFTYLPLHVFLNEVNGSVMIVSEIKISETHGISTEIIDEIRSVIVRQSNEKNIKEAKFIKDGIIFNQFLIQGDDTVNFKFIFLNEAHDLFQIDYIVPRAVYLSESKAIESSIGSIN